MSEVVSEGKRLIELWLTARNRVENLDMQRSSAACDVLNAEAALAKWLAPDDAKPGEKIAVWFGDSLIQVEIGGVVTETGEGPGFVSSTRVTIRKRGPKL